MDENVKNKQISDEELENVGGGKMIGMGESMKNQPVKEVNLSDIMEEMYGKKGCFTRTCELCGQNFSVYPRCEKEPQKICISCFSERINKFDFDLLQ